MYVYVLACSKIEMGLKEKDAAGKGADLAQLLGQMESLKQSKALVEGEKRALEDGPLRACRDDFGDIIDISEVCLCVCGYISWGVSEWEGVSWMLSSYELA